MLCFRPLRLAFCAMVVTAMAYAQTPTFSQQKYPVGSNPQSVTTGFVNSGDADLDIVTGNHDSRTVSVLINNADNSGTFRAALDYTTLTASPDQVVSDDFNRDGLADVAFISKATSTLAIMYARPDGSLTAPVPVDFGGGVPTSLVTNRFNGDDFADLAVTVDTSTGGAASGAVRVINNSGTNATDGSAIFAPAVTIISGPGTFSKLATGNTRGTGFLANDLVFILCCSSNAALPNIIEEEINNGNGTFTPRPVDQGTAVGVLLSDVDGDFRDDIIEPFGPLGCNGCSSRQGVTWIFNEANGTLTKSGTTFSGTQFLTGFAATGVFTPNVGGRGFALTATGSVPGSSGPDEVLVYTPTGTRSFNPPTAISLGTGVGVNDIKSFQAVNAPKQLTDLVVSLGASNQVDVLRNITPGTAPCAIPTTAGVKVCSPTNGSTVNSPVQISASANGGGKAITAMKAYIDGVQVASSGGNQLIASIPTATGAHRLNVNAWNAAGTVFTFSGTFTVGSGGTPPPPGSCSAPTTTPAINICAPLPSQSVSSPVNILASARWDGKTISHMRVYVDNVARCDSGNSNISCQVALPVGSHSLTVNTWNTTGTVMTKTQSFIVH
jgi:hypothetical protein